MREYVVMADSDSEIPYYFAEEHNVPVYLVPYSLDGEEKLFDLGKNTDFKAYYEAIRNGAQASTATRPPIDIQEFFEDILKQGKDILYIVFSSKLSGHFELCELARKNALENYPEARIELIDTKSIAMGAGLLVWHAVKMQEAGKSFDAVAQWVRENCMHALHFFSVDDLMHLKRTGRVSAVSATLGTILDLKPVLLLKRDGTIVAYDKVKGRRKLVKYLINTAQENFIDEDIYNDILVIGHADNPEGAALLKKEAEERLGFKNILLMDIGPVIGAHCGPGTLCLCFLGKERPE